MAISKAMRARAPRKTENYVVSIKKLFGEPDTIPDVSFLKGKYITTGENLNTPADNESAYSVSEPIGFNIEINDKIYKEFSVAMAGWIFLRDPSGGSTGVNFWTDILDAFSNIYDNHQISVGFSYDHIFLPIWFDRNHSVASSVAALQADAYSSTISAAVAANIASGIDNRNWPYDKLDYGVRYVNHYDSQKGKCLLVRWTASQRYYGDRLKFELALFENGTIEYRYWPIKNFQPSDTTTANSSATVGAFWSGPSFGQNKFRDFAPLLDYGPKSRRSSPFGGAVYDPSYSDSGDNYSVNIGKNNWPKNGAVITFSPPVKTGVFLPRKISSLAASTKHLTSRGGIFDDRKTFNYFADGKVILDMPSTMPSRLIGDTGDINIPLRQLLFTSGSLQVTGSMKKHVIDSQLEILNVFDDMKVSKNFSFNESQKNYQETSVTSSFYATGSALEIFGDGFTTPLKSKTQFRISLPVSKQSTMPSLTSSFYYYDTDKKLWSMVDPSGNKDIGLFLYGIDGDGFTVGQDYYYLHRVAETSRGFDAVGRKLVSGSNNVFFLQESGLTSSFQSDNAIGSVVNQRSSYDPMEEVRLAANKIAFAEATNREYLASITDNSKFFPSKSQMFDLKVDYPFLIEKVVVELPLYISGAWFDDVTTCNRAVSIKTTDPFSAGYFDNLQLNKFVGPLDFGGPGLTFGLMCARKGEKDSYLDLIASGTITHMNDAIADVVLKKDPLMRFHCMRPIGFNSFANPTYVVSGSNNTFEGTVKLEMESSVAGGLTIARHDKSICLADLDVWGNGGFGGVANADFVNSNRSKAIDLLTRKSLLTRGEKEISFVGTFPSDTLTIADYEQRAPRVFLQQISPLARGTTKINFNGNSILGGNIASFNFENIVKNPLYVKGSTRRPSQWLSVDAVTYYPSFTSDDLPAYYTNEINSASFGFEAFSLYSTVDSRPAPYLILPGDKLTISLSKTRPVVYKAMDDGTYTSSVSNLINGYDKWELTGSHGTVMLNTGSINITIYGSYIQEGMEYHL